MEARRADGNSYPPTTIANLLSVLYWLAKNYDRHCPNFMDWKKPAFKELTGALEVRYCYQTDIHIALCTHETADYMLVLQTVTRINVTEQLSPH